MRHLSLECRFEAWFVDFRRQIQRQNANVFKGNLLNALIFGKYKGKMFLCPKCGIYLLNAALKRDLSISEGKYKGKMQMQRQMHRKMFLMPLMRHLYLECRFEAWFVVFQKANTKAKCKCKGKCIGKWFLCHKCGIYLLSAALKRDLSISEDKYKGKMQMQRQLHRKMFFMP